MLQHFLSIKPHLCQCIEYESGSSLPRTPSRLTAVSCTAVFPESRRAALSKDAHLEQNLDDLTVLKSLADSQKSKETTVTPPKKDDQYVPDESDSTKSRRLAEDYDSTKNGMDNGKYQGASHRTGRGLVVTFDLAGRWPNLVVSKWI